MLLRPLPLLLLVLLTAWSCGGSDTTDPEVARWEARAKRVTITRDDWGIPHVRGASDADVVFGVLYAQAEDDFHRIEMNYLNALGRMAEADGESALWRDLRMRLVTDPDTLQARYAASPDWLKALMDAFADGLNYYLHTHPDVRPAVLARFEPWMALAFSEGSIGWDIETVSLGALARFYGDSVRRVADAGPVRGALPPVPAEASWPREPTGSNGIAIAPSNSATGKALLLINPHTSFFFRAEAQMTSDEGLNAYGAITWGQFFIYQGFNERVGWMHTSSGADAIDEYLLRVTKAGDGWTYRYDGQERPVTTRPVTLRVKTDTGVVVRTFTTFHSHHGPVVRAEGDQWVAVRLMNDPVAALTQSYTRTKARGWDDFRASMELHTNSSNNTIYADADGNIAYFHANFVPKRDPAIDWRRPVRGDTSATEWQGVHGVEESPFVRNPASGWIQNTNNWPYTAAGADSPVERDFAAYFDYSGENPRGIHAVRLLERQRNLSLQGLLDLAYDPELPAFDTLLPVLITDHERAPASHPLKQRLVEPIALLGTWNRQWGVASSPTTLAVYWGEELWRQVRADAERAGVSVYEYMARRATPDQRLGALAAAMDTLEAHFGTWRLEWGTVNRFQRLTGDIVQPFNDSLPSLPVGFTSARWGSLASFGARTWPGTRKLYGTSGNSFVAVVEFGDRVTARAVSAGGQSGDPTSPHFNDQAERYTTGNLRPVHFHPDELKAHTTRAYRPGR
jgi:acyl-homoserine-lactone acylase